MLSNDAWKKMHKFPKISLAKTRQRNFKKLRFLAFTFEKR